MSAVPSGPSEWEAQYDCDTLQRAKEIMASPERMSKAQAFAKRKAAELHKIAGGGSDSGTGEALMKGYRSLS